jgi:hypothetical protein
MNNVEKAIIVFIFLLFAAFAFLLWQVNSPKKVLTISPQPPTELTIKPLSAIEVRLTWKDNSDNEDGFLLFRDGIKITQLSKNIKTYTDKMLRPATVYLYELKSFNQYGESDFVSFSIHTPNPPIQVWIDKVGVHENGEEGEPLREYTILGQPGKGEEYICIMVKDNKDVIEKELHRSLHKDEVATVNLLIFDSKEVGENLRLVATAYEDDGGSAEQLAYKAIGEVATAGFDMPIAILLKLVGVDFSKIFADIFADLFAAGDDYMGSYGCDWDGTNNWGVGEYVDIGCKRENGNIGLRLWFRIICPIYDYTSEKN